MHKAIDCAKCGNGLRLRGTPRKPKVIRAQMRNRHTRRLLLLFGLALLLASFIVACGEQASPLSPTMATSPSSFSFDAQQGGANPASQTLSVWNSGDGTLSWSASDSADWLILSPTKGSSIGEIDNITLSVDISGMNAGNYAAVIIISAPEAANTPQTVVVNLTINPPAEEKEEKVEEEVIDALDTERLLDIGYNHPEEIVTVEGVIVRTHYAKSSKGQPTFLDFHDPYEGYFKCVIWEEDRQTFIQTFPPNPETYFLNMRVSVKGKIEIYKGDPEITLRDPTQIWIVEYENAVLVTHIIDGDTIEIEGGQHVRYIGIDTPERGEPYYVEAEEANRNLVEGKEVRLEKDIEDKDEYGRLLRYVWVDDIMVNAELVRLGYAYSHSYPPNTKYQAYFLQLEKEAREQERGLWDIYSD